ncbi:MAG TPA: glycosyltransferase [bacterium]|nr:glycosyltransferase [bacterium]
MILLFTTRKVDKNDERTGFVSGWLLELSKHLSKLIVICQEKGDISDLPKNIEVYSLGKEKGYNKLKQITNFQFLMAKKIKEVNGIFSHMVPHYAVLAGPWSKIYHKKLVQWYVHKTVSPWLKMANMFVDEYVTTNPESFQLKTKKPINYFGHGINVNKFKPITSYQLPITSFIILSISRISPSKNIDLMIKAIEKILNENPELKDVIQLQIIGGPALKEQQKYYDSLADYIVENKLTNNIQLLGPMSPEKVLPYYQNCDLFLNLSETGSVDKAVLEAMACEKIVLTSNVAFKNIVPAQLFLAEKNIDLLANKTLEIYNLSQEEKGNLQKKLRQEIVDNHNLKNLAQKIIKLF